MSYKSKRSKATDIPPAVKEKVFKRDNGKCIVCRKPGAPNAHYKRRAQGGLGIEQNVVTLCPECHMAFDDGPYRNQIGVIVREYLKSIYGSEWNEKELIYNKWNGFKYSK